MEFEKAGLVKSPLNYTGGITKPVTVAGFICLSVIYVSNPQGRL